MAESLAEDFFPTLPMLAPEPPLAATSKRLAKAFDRLNQALLKQDNQPRLAEELRQLKTASDVLAGENAALLQDKLRLETLLLETVNKYDQLLQLTKAATQKLEDSIAAIDTLLEAPAA